MNNTGRICIEIREDNLLNFNVNRENISQIDTLETLKRLSMWCKEQYFAVNQLYTLDAVEHQEIVEGEPMKICITHHTFNHKIQVAFSGITNWEASFILDYVVQFLHKEFFGVN